VELARLVSGALGVDLLLFLLSNLGFLNGLLVQSLMNGQVSHSSVLHHLLRPLVDSGSVLQVGSLILRQVAPPVVGPGLSSCEVELVGLRAKGLDVVAVRGSSLLREVEQQVSIRILVVAIELTLVDYSSQVV
jgi:hypothetical protein